MTTEQKAISTPYSVRLPEDIKGKLIATLSASGYTAPEFFDRMVNSFQVQEGNKPSRPEVVEIARAMKRISEAVEALSVVVDNTEQDKIELSRDYASESEQAANELIIANEQTAEVQQALIQSQKEIEVLRVDHQKNLSELLKEINRLKSVEDLINEVRQESKDTKESLKVALAEKVEADRAAEQAVSASKELKVQMTDLESRYNNVQQQTEKTIAELNGCKEQLNMSAAEVNTLRNQLDAERQTGKEQQQQFNIDIQQAVLSAKGEAMEKREQLQNELIELKAHVAKLEAKKPVTAPKVPKGTASTTD